MPDQEWTGNDTIDPSPLIPGEAAKILCITPETFTEISQAFNAFLGFLKGHKSRDVFRPKRLSAPKEALPEDTYQRDYEPTNAIYVNECDYRRWCRVNEWFAEFGPEDQKSERTLRIQ